MVERVELEYIEEDSTLIIGYPHSGRVEIWYGGYRNFTQFQQSPMLLRMSRPGMRTRRHAFIRGT